MAVQQCAGPNCHRNISISGLAGGNPVALANPEAWATRYMRCEKCGLYFCDHCVDRQKKATHPSCLSCGAKLYTPDKQMELPITVYAVRKPRSRASFLDRICDRIIEWIGVSRVAGWAGVSIPPQARRGGASGPKFRPVKVRTLPSLFHEAKPGEPRDFSALAADLCFGEGAYKRAEYHDTRTLADFSETKAFAVLMKAGRYADVVQSAAKVRKQAPDWWGSYVASASALRMAGDHEAAKRMIDDGNRQSLSSYMLEAETGNYYWHPHENIDVACVHWIRSVVIQLSITDRLANVSPAAYLREIADSFGWPERKSLDQLVRASGADDGQLSETEAHAIRVICGQIKESTALSIRRRMERLCQFYLSPEHVPSS